MQDYSPKTIDDIVFESIVDSQKVNFIANGTMKFPYSGKTGILLHGRPGTGKTALARIFIDTLEASKTTNSAKPYVAFDIKCTAGTNGVELISRIEKCVSYYASNASNLHYIILNEVDCLTPPAAAQLKMVMEYPNAVFVFTTNNIQKLEAALLSRCVEVSLNPSDPKVWLPRLRSIIISEGLSGDAFSENFLMQHVLDHKIDARNIIFGLQIKIAQKILNNSALPVQATIGGNQNE